MTPADLSQWAAEKAPTLDAAGWRRYEKQSVGAFPGCALDALAVAQATAVLARRKVLAVGLTEAEREFLHEVAHITRTHDGCTTSRLFRKAVAESLRAKGLLDVAMMDIADGDGFLSETKSPRPAYFFTLLGREVDRFVQGDR